MQYRPHDYQQYTIDRMIREPKVFAVLEMGLGKTSCTLTAINELMRERYEVNRVLIIAPLRVADDTWESEIDKWDHLQGLRISKMIGSREERIRALDARADVYTINRENVPWLVELLLERKQKWPFDMIVIDESSSFKNHQAKRFKALLKVAPLASRMILLTGTPEPNGEMDLWAQMRLLDGGERLGRYITRYRDTYFTPGRRNGNIVYDYKLRPGAADAIHAKLKDVMISLTAADNLKMPERIDNVIRLKMPKKAAEQYRQMERDAILELEKQEENGAVVAGNRAAVSNKLLQIANGAVYYEDNQGEKQWTDIHDAKLDALQEILEDNEGKPVLVFYSFRHDYDRMMERFKGMNPGTIKDREDIKRWNEGKIRLLIAHPASMGHGLNLQAGGNIIVWFGVPNNLEHYLQANARLYRQGQTQTVIINHLLMEGTHDEDVMDSLQAKRVSQDDLIAAVKARVRAIQK